MHNREEIIKLYWDNINKIIEDCGYLVSIKILYPSNLSLTSLTPLLVLADDKIRDSYKILDERFVDKENNFYSLTFLKYKDAIKYKRIENQNGIDFTKQDSPFIFQDETIPLRENDVLKHLRDENNVNPYWKRWIQHIKDFFPYGKSTLWSYAVLRRSDKEIITSAYLIFSEDISRKKALEINKVCQDLLHEFIMQLYVTELKRSKFEKEQIERERNFHVGMAHYIKNSMTGLASQEGEIIRFVSRQDNSEKIRLIAKTQKLIYYLINLVLLLRQKSDVLVIGKMEPFELNRVEISIPIINLIETAYIHTILSKNKLQNFIDNWSSQDLSKAEKAIEEIETDLNLIKDSFLLNKINEQGLFKSWVGNFIFETLRKENDLSLLRLDDKNDIQYSMTINQCKSIYAAFLEIFDNIYGIKHNMSNASVKLEENKIKIIAYNSIRKVINWENDFTDLICEPKTNGLGLRIIKAAFEDCNCKFSFTNGTAKEDKVNERTIKTYCYQIERNI